MFIFEVKTISPSIQHHFARWKVKPNVQCASMGKVLRLDSLLLSADKTNLYHQLQTFLFKNCVASYFITWKGANLRFEQNS